jgi:hypothetical protein
MFEDPLCSPLASMAWTHRRVRADGSVLPPGNFKTDATVRPSHGSPCGHRPTVRPSVIVRVTTLPPTEGSLGYPEKKHGAVSGAGESGSTTSRLSAKRPRKITSSDEKLSDLTRTRL